MRLALVGKGHRPTAAYHYPQWLWRRTVAGCADPFGSRSSHGTSSSLQCPRMHLGATQRLPRWCKQIRGCEELALRPTSPTTLCYISAVHQPDIANSHGLPYSLKSQTPSSGRSTLATPCPAFRADTRRSRIRLSYGKEIAWILSVPDSIKHAYLAGPDRNVSE